ncbi:putative peptidase, partial [Coniochaeta sp. 2T2.1]
PNTEDSGGPPRIGPGPFPPGIRLPPIPWPQITIGPGSVPTYSQMDPDEDVCETATAQICTYTESFDVLAKFAANRTTPTLVLSMHTYDKRATTTATSTISFCTSVTGCGATDITETSTSSVLATPSPHVIIPADPLNVGALREAVQQRDMYESATDGLGTMFFFIPALTEEQVRSTRERPDVSAVYFPKGPCTKNTWNALNAADGTGAAPLHREKPQFSNNSRTTSCLRKRGEVAQPYTLSSEFSNLEIGLISQPPGTGPINVYNGFYRYDESAGFGTFVYNCDTGIVPSHAEFADVTISPLYPGPFPVREIIDNHPIRHGTKTMAKAVGKNIGIARRALALQTVWDYDRQILETWLDALVKIYQDIKLKRRGNKSVVNLSISMPRTWFNDRPSIAEHRSVFLDRFAYVIRELIALEAVVVTGAGNTVGPPDGYPALFGDPQNERYIPKLIVVGGVKIDGQIAPGYNDANWVSCFAPGHVVRVPDVSDETGHDHGYMTGRGSSYSNPTVAALAAYFRGIDWDGLGTVAAVKERILELVYRRPRPRDAPDTLVFQRDVVFNGQAGGRSEVGQCEAGGALRRRAGGSCPLAVPPEPSPVTFRTGPPGPICASGSRCGSLCEGFFCEGSPLQQNPDFLDPLNPDSVQNPTGPNYGNWNGNRTITPLPTRPPTTPTPPVTPKPSQNPTTTTGP